MKFIKQYEMFNSFEEFQQTLRAFEHRTNTVFVIRNSKTVRIRNEELKLQSNTQIYPLLSEKLKYASVRYVCKHSGSHKSRSRGLRLKTA